MLRRSINAVLMIAIFFVSSVLALDCPAPKRAVPIPTLKSLSYHRARARLFAAGWIPVQTKPRGVNPDNNPDISSGNGRLFWERGYLEIESCAGTGLSPCSFRWADKFGNQIRVVTRGEEMGERKVFATVSSSKFLCPAEE